MIKCQGLTKTFQSYKKEPGITGSIKALFKRNYIEKSAVENFNLDIRPGEIIGLLGPNGAGKTTLMKMFTGIIVPSSGTLEVLGFKPHERDKEFRKKISLVMGQKSQLWWDIPAMDSFLLLQKYYEIPKKNFNERVGYLSDLLEVKKYLHIHVRKLSLGERMKLELMASLLHDPKIIFLDEPTIGLDLLAQENIRDFIKAYHQEHKVTLILTSHYMADVAALCKRLVLIFEGKKRYDGSIENFEKYLGQAKMVSFSFSKPQEPMDSIWEGLDATWSAANDYVELRIAEEDLRPISTKILAEKEVIEFSTEKMPIERVMKTLLNNPELLRKSSES
jgi:ABC-2 type transport system ATP-binding protein